MTSLENRTSWSPEDKEHRVLYTRNASEAFDEVVNRLSECVTAHHFGVIESIDLHAKMNAKGVAFGPRCTILEVCNPAQAKAVLEQNMSISTALPCRISVYEQDGGVVVSTARPTRILGLYDQSPAMREIAQGVEDTLIAIIDDTCDARSEP